MVKPDDEEIEQQVEKVVEEAERAQAPLLEALELVRKQLTDSAASLEEALVEAKQALTVLELLRRQVQSLRAKIREGK